MRRLVLVIIVELIFAVGLGGWVCTKFFTTHAHIAEMDAEIAKLQPRVKQIESYDSASAELQPKLDLLNQAKSTTMRWYNTLDQMTQSMPQSTWLTRISAVPPAQDSNMSVTICGISATQAKVGETMMRLHNNKEFESVDLHFTQKTCVQDRVAVEFEIGATMKTDDQAKGVAQNESGKS
jgi:Tfp pilus assembly protein PilN